MIFENTWQDEIVLHEAFINDNADVSIREVTLGGDPIEDFVDYHPSIGASDDELTKICDDIYQTLMGAFVAEKMTTRELLEESLKKLKIIQLDNLKREPNHPRNKFDYTVIVPDHPLGYHEHYTNDLKVAKKSAIEWATDYGRASVEDRNLETVFAVR